MTIVVSETYQLAEHDLYGSSRIGTKNYTQQQAGMTWTHSGGNQPDTALLWNRTPWYSLEYQDLIATDSVNPYGRSFIGQYYAQHLLGQKQYELTDHLGDVLATVSDKRANGTFTGIGGSLTTGSSCIINTYQAILASEHDYYPFGQYMPGRYMSDTSTTCFTTTLTEVVPTTYRVYNQLLPILHSGELAVVGHAELKASHDDTDIVVETHRTYEGMSYNMTGMAQTPKQSVTIETPMVSGDFDALITDDSSGDVLGSARIYNTDGDITSWDIRFSTESAHAHLTITSEASGHGVIVINGLYTIRDTTESITIVTTVCDQDKYRYGFNGKLKDNEWAGLGNHYNYGMRVYDPRIGRPLSVDPLFKKYPMLTPYQFFSNSPIQFTDLDGGEGSAEIHIRQMETGYLKGTVTKDQLMSMYNSNAQAAVIGGTFIAGGELAVTGNLLKAALISGSVGAGVNATYSAATGQDGSAILRSAVSGFVGGVILATVPGGSFVKGAAAGIAEDATDQFMENMMDGKEFNLTELAISGGISGVANAFSENLVSSVSKSIDKTAAKEIKTINSSAYKSNLRAVLKQQGYSGRALNNEVKRLVGEQSGQVAKEAKVGKAAAKQAIERFIDGISNAAKSKANE